jgi:hypothetical protein
MSDAVERAGVVFQTGFFLRSCGQQQVPSSAKSAAGNLGTDDTYAFHNGHSGR